MGLSFDAPVPASLDPWALALSAAAVLAIFRFKAGMIPTLLACAVLGVRRGSCISTMSRASSDEPPTPGPSASVPFRTGGRAMRWRIVGAVRLHVLAALASQAIAPTAGGNAYFIPARHRCSPWTQGCRGSLRERSASPARRCQAGSTASGLPRTDLQVTLDGVEIKPALALGSWLAFHGRRRGQAWSWVTSC